MDIVERFKLFFRVMERNNLGKMIEEEKKSKKERSYKSTALNIVIVSLIFAVITLIILFAIQPTVNEKTKAIIQEKFGSPEAGQLQDALAQYELLMNSLTSEGVILSVIIQTVSITVGFFIMHFSVFYLSKLLGGKATSRKQAYLFSLLYSSFLLAFTAIMLAIPITFIINPTVAIIPSLLIYVSGIYYFYLAYKLIKEIQEMDLLRTAGIIILTVVISMWATLLLSSLTGAA